MITIGQSKFAEMLTKPGDREYLDRKLQALPAGTPLYVLAGVRNSRGSTFELIFSDQNKAKVELAARNWKHELQRSEIYEVTAYAAGK